MATQVYSSVLRHATDADFRAWGKEVSDALQACGLAKVADAGQINWATAVRPAAGNGVAGYEIYYLDDSLHATFPIYIKIEYGSNAAATSPGIWVTLGSGRDGSGSITGAYFPRVQTVTNSGIASTTAVFASYVCVTAGFAGLCFKAGSITGSNSRKGFMICRSVDSSGEINGDGLTLYYGANQNAALAVTSYGAATNEVFTGTEGSYCLVPFGQASGLFAGNTQVLKHYTVTPRVRPNPYALTVFTNEVSVNSTFKAKVVGGKERNYICVGANGFGQGAINGLFTAHSVAMPWE